MPLELTTLTAGVASIHRDYGEAGDLNVEYYPMLITERTLTMLSIGEIEKPEQLAEMMARFNAELCRVIKRWDVTINGVVVPLTPDALSTLPLPLRVQVLTEIASDVRMGEASGSASKRLSRSGRRSAARATGSRR